MVALLLVLAALIALGVAAVRGWLPDTRDAEFSLGRVVRGRDDAAPSKPTPAETAPEMAGVSPGASGQPLGTSPTRKPGRLVLAS